MKRKNGTQLGLKTLTRSALLHQFDSHALDMGLSTEVFSDGPIDARVAFVGEGPGEQEVRKRLPFVGVSGTLLWDALRRFGITRESVYSTNVVKRQISLSRSGGEKHSVSADELDKWKSMLDWELAQLPNCEVVVALGNYALEALTGYGGITKWRGSVLDATLPNGKDGKVIATFNPAYVVPGREPRFEPFFIMDCQKVDMVSRGVFRPHIIDEIINPTYREARAFIRDLRKAGRPVALDDEAINGEVACIGLANNPHRAMCINFRDMFKNRYTTSEEVDILLDIQALSESNRMIAQNAQFDSYFNRLHVWLVNRFWFDILLAHHALYPHLPHNLAFIVSQYTMHPFYKDDADAWKEGGDIDTYWRYNCKDAALTYACYERLEKELAQQGMDKIFYHHNDPKLISIMRAQPHLVDATVHGVAIDMPVKEKILVQVQRDVDMKMGVFIDLARQLVDDPEYTPNPNSWPQMQELFFDKLGLEGKGRSTNEANRNLILKNPKTPALAKEMLVALDAYKEDEKFRSTYATSKVSPDNRFRCEYKQFGVAKAPGRLSSSRLLVEREGGNMQNQPMRARGMYIADPDCVLLYFDLAQAEAQVVGFRADIPIWKEQFAQAKKDGKFDCHRALASQMFKMPYDSVPLKDWDENLQPTKRYIAKRCRHGLNYRMEKFRLSQVTQLPFHEASRAFSLYHSITPELRKWWEAEEAGFRKTRFITNAFGRRLRVFQRIDDDVLESIIAFYPQSTIGDKITQTWYMCEEDDNWPKFEARVCIDVHDNLVAVSTKKAAKSALRVMKKHAESVMWLQDVYGRREPEPLSIAAELKMSYPTVWDDKTEKFVPDKKGLHRWSEMEVVHL